MPAKTGERNGLVRARTWVVVITGGLGILAALGFTFGTGSHTKAEGAKTEARVGTTEGRLDLVDLELVHQNNATTALGRQLGAHLEEYQAVRDRLITMEANQRNMDGKLDDIIMAVREIATH